MSFQHYVEKIAPAMGPIAPLFGLLGSIFGADLGSVDKGIKEARELMMKSFQEIKGELSEVQDKLEKIYDSILQISEFNKIEAERSFLNSIQQAIEDGIKYPENATRQALWRLCDDPLQAPVYILQRLDEYVHRNYLPPHLKTALFEFAKLSVPRLVSVTKYILADVIRAVIYQQTCLGLANASKPLQSATFNRNFKILSDIGQTLTGWEQALVPDWAANGEFAHEAMNKLVEFGSDR